MTDIPPRRARFQFTATVRQTPDDILRFPDGARILHFAPNGPAARRVVLFGRTTFTADDPFLARLIEHLRHHAIGFDIFESPLESAFSAINRQPLLHRLPRLVQRLVKFAVVAAQPRLWKCIPRRLQGVTAYTQSREESFLVALRAMNPKPSIAIGRSAGAIAITRNAEAFGFKALICVGYAFRNPALGDEPARYRHLATLSTPCLILQGEHDPYGDGVTARGYPLSPTTSLRFFDGSHDMSMSEETLQILLNRIVAFICAH